MPGFTKLVNSEDASETEAAGARLAARLRPGDVVLVRGELGAGKTTFIRGACRALGVDAPVTSPTFEIGHVYEHRPGRTLSEADNTWFSLLTMNQHPLHIDAVYGAVSDALMPIGSPLASTAGNSRSARTVT